jgi:hypothetical protein
VLTVFTHPSSWWRSPASPPRAVSGPTVSERFDYCTTNVARVGDSVQQFVFV